MSKRTVCPECRRREMERIVGSSIVVKNCLNCSFGEVSETDVNEVKA